VLSALAARLLVPFVSEASQGWRTRTQVIGAILVLLGLILWGLLGGRFTPDRSVLARAPGADRAIVLVDYGGEVRELRVWAGGGLGERDMGRLGPACGNVLARFLEHDRVEIESAYGTFQFRLDPATGEPLEDMGDRCAGDR
jgi:hypothetical protein